MDYLTTEGLRKFLKVQESPCISLYQPTHRTNPDNLQDPIRYKNLVRDAERSLRENYKTRDVKALLEPFQELANDYHFWTHQRHGLAVLAANGMFEVFRLRQPVKELVVVADSFHVKPLLRMVQSADRYQVLCLDRHEATLLEGNRDALEYVELEDMPSTLKAALGEVTTEPHQAVGVYGKRAGTGHMAHGGTGSFPGLGGRKDEVQKDMTRFFQVIDREVMARFSAPSGLPLLLVALPEYHTEFRRISRNPFLLPESVTRHPSSLTVEQLRTEAWRVIEPRYLERLARLTDDYKASAARGKAASDVNEVAKAAVANRIGVLLVDADRVIPGRFDRATGTVQPGEISQLGVVDLIDDLAEEVLRSGGEVVVVPTARMPSDSGLAATFRH